MHELKRHARSTPARLAGLVGTRGEDNHRLGVHLVRPERNGNRVMERARTCGRTPRRATERT